MELKKSLEKKLKDAKMHTLWNIDDYNKSIKLIITSQNTGVFGVFIRYIYFMLNS